MKRIYTVEEMKGLIFEINDVVVDVLSLTDYCESLVLGYNDFKSNNELTKNDVSNLIERYAELKQEAQGIYETLKNDVLAIEPIDGFVEDIKSSPISKANCSIRQSMAHADSGAQLLQYAKQAQSSVQAKIAYIMSKAQSLADVKNMWSINVEQGIENCVSSVLDVTEQGLKGLKMETKFIVAKEERYSDK